MPDNSALLLTPSPPSHPHLANVGSLEQKSANRDRSGDILRHVLPTRHPDHLHLRQVFAM